MARKLRLEYPGAIYHVMNRLGNEEFRQELLTQVSEKRGLWHYGAELQESAQAKAQQLISAHLKHHNWTELDLAARPKGDPLKLELAIRLSRETTMTVSWIAQRLHMGTRGHLTHLLYWHGQPKVGTSEVPAQKLSNTID